MQSSLTNTLSILLTSAELEKELNNDTIVKLKNSTKCQLTADKVSEVTEGVDKCQEKMRVCYNVAKSVNEVPHRQSISHGVCKPVSEEACEGKFH